MATNILDKKMQTLFTELQTLTMEENMIERLDKKNQDIISENTEII